MFPWRRCVSNNLFNNCNLHSVFEEPVTWDSMSNSDAPEQLGITPLKDMVCSSGTTPMPSPGTLWQWRRHTLGSETAAGMRRAEAGHHSLCRCGPGCSCHLSTTCIPAYTVLW